MLGAGHNDLTYCQNPTTRDQAAGTNNYRMACNMTGGSSGGPWTIFNSRTTATDNAANSASGNTIVN